MEKDAEFGGALSLGLAMGGDVADAPLLVELARSRPDDAIAVAALGVLGNAQTADFLIELSQAEVESVRSAADAALTRIFGTPAGRWADKWRRDRHLFDPRCRYRNGEVFGPGACIREMADPRSVLTVRDQAYRELLVTARVAIPYEADGFVARQQAGIKAWNAWAEA